MAGTKHGPSRSAEREPRLGRRQHSLAFKRRLIEQTLVPGASVARIALENGVNANLLFKWRRQHVRAARSAPSSLLPVILSEPKSGGEAAMSAAPPAARMAAGGGVIEVELPAGRIRIKGTVDLPALRAVLQMLAPAA
jgi:transposase